MSLADSKLGRPAEILLVEDSEMDAKLTRKGFERSRFDVNLHHVENGQECMQFLRKNENYSDAPSPDLVLLDLNLPVMDGREVLSQISADENLRQIPVVILTTSSSDGDLTTMYKLRCNSFLTKPVSFKEFQQLLEEFGNYWFTVVMLPPRKE